MNLYEFLSLVLSLASPVTAVVLAVITHRSKDKRPPSKPPEGA